MLTNPFKIAAAILGGALALGLMVAIGAAVKHVGDMRRDALAFADCAVVAGMRRGQVTSPPRCPAAIGDALARDAMARACDDGLAKGPAGAFVVSQACSAAVKTVVAARDAAQLGVADRDKTITSLKAARSADVARAEARGLSQAKRISDAQAVLDAAPRDPGGLVRCDARCLSVLAGDTP